jgi:hypothetical protein
MLISVAINSTFRLILRDNTELFTLASEAAAGTLLLLMIIIHYFIVEYYRQLVDFNEKERQGENNRLRQVSAWLRAFPSKHNNEDKCSKCHNQEMARRGTGVSHVTSRANFAGVISNINLHNQLSPDSSTETTAMDGKYSPEPSIFDCDEHHQPLSIADELEEDEVLDTRHLPRIANITSPSRSLQPVGHKAK